MKYLVVSDIHGSIYYTKKMIELFEKYKCDKILCLGDVLYHGPRNDLPAEYNPKEVVKLLNQYKNQIICVRGNCDAYVDEMVLEFPIVDLAAVNNEGINAYLTHGHIYNPNNPLNASKGSIVFYGHFHVQDNKVVDGVRYINVGSITLPKNNTKNSVAIFSEKKVEIISTLEELIEEIIL